MESPFDTFAARNALSPAVRERVTWGTMPLDANTYVTPATPPDALVTSARAIVLRPGAGRGATEVLLVRHPNEVHVVPGGRLEPGETPEQALHRELREEAGWRVDGVTPLGFVHYRHLGTMPDGYRYPHPDFVQRVYAARAASFVGAPTSRTSRSSR